MSDLPPFFRGTSPGFGMARQGQVLTRVYWADVIAASSSQVNSTAVALPNYLFTVDSIHLYNNAKGPQRYILDIDFSTAPGAFVRYLTVTYEGFKTFRLSHASGAGILGVNSFRETIYNDNDQARNFNSHIFWIYNEP